MPTKDPEKKRAASRKHYSINAEAVKAKVAEKKKQYRREWATFKSMLACIRCGENHPATFDFHHVEPHPLDRKVHKLIANGAYNKAVEEIKKCVVFCSNCHRIFHFEERLKAADSDGG